MAPLLHESQHELWLFPPSRIAERRHICDQTAICLGGYFFMGIHFCLLLELATTVSMKSMPLTPASTAGKSRASSLGFSPAMKHLTVSAKLT
jgi:hypothetical protein